MKSFAVSTAFLTLFSINTSADFVIGGYSGEQLAGTWGQPGQLTIGGTFISTGIPGQSDKKPFGNDDFCQAGTSAGPGEWAENTRTNYCDLPIPGCDPNLRIVRSAGSFSGDCGESVGDPDAQKAIGYNYGEVIHKLWSPNAAVGNCYYLRGKEYKNCASTGSVYYSGSVLCLIGQCGGDYTDWEGVVSGLRR